MSESRSRGLPAGFLEHIDLALGLNVKILCSAVFLSGRDLDEAIRNSSYLPQPRPGQKSAFEARVDREARTVTLSFEGGLSRTARYVGGQGSVVLPGEGKEPMFRPVPVETSLPPAATQPWPMGDAPPQGDPPSPLDPDLVSQAVDLAFSNPDDLTAVFVAVHGGRIVAERYGQGADRETQLESWSMGKSVTAALVGVLIQEGHFKLEDPAPISEWQRAGDPRGRITVADLMQMSSGLRFTSSDDPREWEKSGFPDHVLVYTGTVDVFRYSITRPAEFPPGTVGRYRNCDPLSLGYIIRETVRRRGEEYLTFPQSALFDRIGIRRQVLETDPYGNFLLTGFDYGAGRNWARLGLLFLRDGVWLGERILPEGFVDFVRRPAPAWEEPEYGGQFWVNGTGEWNLPTDAFYMSGAGGQHVFIVPSHDLVIVRMGHLRGALTHHENLRAAQGKLIEAVEGAR
jgi:CubicO group peptidase (beta-lactamase class C family)